MSADEIAGLALDIFARLPAKFKPKGRNQTSQEWVPLSAIVFRNGYGLFECISLATGMKCLPRAKVPLANGTVLHDCHAEVLALRAFNRFLLDECCRLRSGGESQWIRARSQHERDGVCPFKIRDDVHINMYCSEAPCGDASMELTMREQEDATAWDVSTIEDSVEQNSGPRVPLRGRGYFSQLGTVRTKPSRPDAPPTLSKSCSDKLALKQCTSLLSGLTSTLIASDNAYLDTLVVPESQYVASACQRAFGREGRFTSLNGELVRDWLAPYSFRPFKISTTSMEFEYSKRSLPQQTEHVASNVSAVWTPDFQEVLINGVLQGRKQFDPRGASRLSRLAMWTMAADVEESFSSDGSYTAACETDTYGLVKTGPILGARRRVKEDVRNTVLSPWPRNEGDDSFRRPASSVRAG